MSLSFIPVPRCAGMLPLIGIILLSGCIGDETSAPPADPSSSNADDALPASHADPHDIPLTEQEVKQLQADTAHYPQALERIRSFRDTIRHETTKGEPNRAHRALDQLDLVLEWLPNIARNSEIPRSEWESINTTSRRLRELFDQIHHAIDEGRRPNYAAVGGEIDRHIERLFASGDSSTESRSRRQSDEPHLSR